MLSTSVSGRLVLSRLLLVVGEWLLVACRATAAWVVSRRVWGGVVVGWVSILLVKLTDALAIPPERKEGQETLLRQMSISKQSVWKTLKVLTSVSSRHFDSEMLKHVLRHRAYPGDDRQEGEGQNSPGGIRYDVYICRGTGPPTSQDTEADEPQECPHRCEE